MESTLVDLLANYPPWQVTLIVLVASLGAAVVIEVVGVGLARRAVTRTETRLDDIVFEEVRWPIVVSAALGGVWYLTVVLDGTQTIVSQSDLDAFFGRPALALIVLLWAWAANQVVNRGVEEVKDRGSRYDFAPVFSNVWTLVVTLGALFSVLSIFKVDVTPLLGAAGIAGIAVGFAAKDTVANFFGGLSLYFDDTYKIGDYIVLDTGEAGTVVRVGIRSTTLLTRDEVLVTVPNSVLNASRVVNQSAPQRRKRIRVPISVAYGTDLDEFEELVLAIAEEERLVLDSPKPRMRFRQFGTSSLDYELLGWVRSPSRERRAQHELNRAIYAGLNDAGIEIPFPQQDVTLRGANETVVRSPETREPATAADPGRADARDADDGPSLAEDGGVDGRDPES